VAQPEIESVYLKVHATVAGARQGIANYIRSYKREHRRQNLARQTPKQVYEGSSVWPAAA
jgi:hypothetical protein